MKEKYRWDYNIKIKTKEGTFEYEKETLDNLGMLLQKHPDYQEIEAKHNKPKVLIKTRGDNNGKVS